MKQFLDKMTLKKIFAKRQEVIAVYAFGSQVNGLTNQDSDFDLAVMVKEREKISPREILKLLLEHPQAPVNLDLACVDLSSSPLFLFQIIKNGKCLYEKSPQERIVLEAAILDLYYDTQHMRDIYHQSLRQSLRKGTYGH